MIKIYFTSFVIIFCWVQVVAQQPDDDWDDLLEQRADQTEEEIEENDDQFSLLKSFSVHPLDLNQANTDDLQNFYFLDPLQIQAFLDYRRLLGKLISIYELQAVPHWDLNTIEKLLPYVTVNKGDPFFSRPTTAQLLSNGGFYGLLRYQQNIEKRKGFKIKDSLGNSPYLGYPPSGYLRLQYKLPQRYSIGITAESDAGEPFHGYGQKGFDFYSYHFFYENKGFLKTLALGDYKINLGQGLINQQGLSFGKTALVEMLDHAGPTIRPHTSAMEFDFYKGAAVKLGGEKLTTTLFISNKKEDARLYADEEGSYFNTIQKSGYHRTLSELNNKNSLRLFSTGGNIRYAFPRGHFTINSVYQRFSEKMKPGTSLYQQFNPEGRDLFNTSVDYALYFNKFYFFGETATDKNGHIATVNSLLMGVDKKVDLALLYRNYSTSYYALYAQSFGEGSQPQNEKGFYSGIIIRPTLKWKLSAYADFFSFPWLRYRVDVPSQGKDYFAQLEYAPSRDFRTYLRFRYKAKPINVLKDDPLAIITNTVKQNLRGFMQWQISKYFRIRDQIEWVQFQKGNKENGYMVYQNIRWTTNIFISGNFRLAYFNTDSYDSRLYTFENNVRYLFYIPSFYGKGMRSYINLRFKIGRKSSIWTKLSRTWYKDRSTIGSNWDEIEGNKQTQLVVQWVWEP